MRFCDRTAVSVHKPTSFWQEKLDTVIILVQGLAKMLPCQNKPRTQKQFQHFLTSKEAQVPDTRITEQSILLTKCKMDCPGYKFSLKTGSQISYSFSSLNLKVFIIWVNSPSWFTQSNTSCCSFISVLAVSSFNCKA